MSFSFTLLFVALVVGILYVQAWRKKNRYSATTWDQLVSNLQELPMNGITKVALDYIQPCKGERRIEVDEIWLLVGGAEGHRRMQANPEMLIQLAAFAQQWDLQESISVGERMRREGLALRRAALKIPTGKVFGYGKATGPLLICLRNADAFTEFSLFGSALAFWVPRRASHIAARTIPPATLHNRWRYATNAQNGGPAISITAKNRMRVRAIRRANRC